jgi:ATP-dependent DNA helicase PIF1
MLKLNYDTNNSLVFAGMLNEMREGRLSASSISTFRSLSRPLNFDDDLDATELFALRSEVERANADRLVNLQGNVEVFEARDGGTIADKSQRDKLLSNCMAPETITLKKGAQVMLIKNIDESLVNGSIGRVIGFMDEGEFDKYCINEEAYTQATDGVIGTQPTLTKEEMARKRLTDNLTTQRKFPLVRFAIADGTSRDLLCQPESWKVELPNGEVTSSPHPRMGSQHPQGPRSNSRARQSRSGQSVRKGPGVRRALACD